MPYRLTAEQLKLRIPRQARRLHHRIRIRRIAARQIRRKQGAVTSRVIAGGPVAAAVVDNKIGIHPIVQIRTEFPVFDVQQHTDAGRQIPMYRLHHIAAVPGIIGVHHLHKCPHRLPVKAFERLVIQHLGCRARPEGYRQRRKYRRNRRPSAQRRPKQRGQKKKKAQHGQNHNRIEPDQRRGKPRAKTGKADDGKRSSHAHTSS